MTHCRCARLLPAVLVVTAALACGADDNVREQNHYQSETRNSAAYNAFLAGWQLLLKRTPEDAVKAIAQFRKAIEIDPGYRRAYAAMAQVYWDNSRDTKFNKLTGEIQMASSVYANDITAWELLQNVGDAPLSPAHALKARMLQRQRRFDEAMREARQAVVLGPDDPTAYDALIENLIYAGELEEAMRLIDESMKHDPPLLAEKLYLKSLAYFVNGSLTSALSAIEQARANNPNQIRYASIHAATLAELGRAEKAKAVFEEYRSGLINFDTLNWTIFYWPFQDTENAERLLASLRKAGLIGSINHYYKISLQNRLQSHQIKSLLANKIMIGADYGPTGSWEEFRVTRDRNAQIVDQDILTYFREGETRIANDLLCDPWYAFGDFCVALYRNPDGTSEQRDEYIFFTLNGIFRFSVFDRAK